VSEQRVVLGDSGVTIVLPEQARETIERREGHPEVHRFFSDGPVVVAAEVRTVEGNAVKAVEEAGGNLISSYRRRARYARASRDIPVIRGAVDATMLDFQWEDDGGVLMRSIAVIAGDGAFVVVVHAAFPEVHGDAAASTAEAIASSCVFPDH
jgi:hypothetical protein